MEVDEDVRQLALQGKRIRAIQLLRERTGADFHRAQAEVNALLPDAHRMRTHRIPLLLIAAMVLGVTLLTLLVFSRVADQLGALLLGPIMAFAGPVILMLLHPGGLSFLAVLVVVVGVRSAPRYRRPAWVRAGSVVIALALVTFWPLQYLAARLVPAPEYSGLLHGAAFLISVCILTGGIEALRRASDTPEGDSWAFLR